jgi:hypothetical protein
VYGIELCAVCDRRRCGATVILSALSSEKKKFDTESGSIALICPACDKSFTVLITEMEWLNVSEEQVRQGYFGDRKPARARSASASSS